MTCLRFLFVVRWSINPPVIQRVLPRSHASTYFTLSVSVWDGPVVSWLAGQMVNFVVILFGAPTISLDYRSLFRSGTMGHWPVGRKDSPMDSHV